MKSIKLMTAAIAAVCMSACNKAEMPVTQPGLPGIINVSVREDGPSTKALSAYTDSEDYEKAVQDVQLFIFDSDGMLNSYKNIGSSTSSSISTTAGTKSVWAVVNGPDLKTVKTLTELKSAAVALDDNSKTGGFVMVGSGSCTVAGTETDCPVVVTRLVSRIALQKITNNLPSSLGRLEVKNIFIANVVGNQNIEGTAPATVWLNKEGVFDEATRNKAHVIDGAAYKASCEELTFFGSGFQIANGAFNKPTSPYLFYAYPNSSTNKPDGFKTTFQAQRTVLTVTAAIDGKVQYYPVVLDDAVLERNKSYTVDLTITGLGSNDPDKPVEKGSVSVSISVTDWVAGATYEETI